VAADGRALPLRGVTLRAEARGGLARVVLHQRFANPHAEALRVTYLVPLPPDAALAGYAFRIDDRRIAGEVDRIAAARERFETALLEGRSAGLVEQERANLFTLELGNVPPGAEVVAELAIDQPLGWLDEGAWEWRFPTVVAPRYLGAEGRVSDAERVIVDVAEGGLAVDVDVALVIADALAGGAAPVSPSHRLDVTAGPEGIRVTPAGEAVALDRDVVVRWPAVGAAPGLGLDTARPAADRPHAGAAYGLLTVTPPSPEGRSTVTPRDLIVLIDTSGSMTGEPLAQARGVAGALVNSLGDADQLELIAFASRPRRWHPQAVHATEAARLEVVGWLAALEAEGSTEMREAVVEALRPLRRDAQRQVVLVTDGLIGFEHEIVAALARDLPIGSRLHTAGVGSSVNRALTAPAARAGRGVEVVVGLGEKVAPHVARLLARMREPVLTEVKISGSALLDHAPRAVPDVYAGAPLRVALRLRPEGGELHVHGLTPAGAWDADVRVAAVAAGQGRPAVVSLYGREAVEDLELSRAAGLPVDERDVERIGLDFQIATRLTSWVAVSEEPSVDPRQPVRRERIPHALPHGMSIEGLGLRAAPAGFALAALARAPAGFTAMFEETAAFSSAPSRPPGRLFTRNRKRADGASKLGRLTGRLVVRKDRELTFEIDVNRDLDWTPEDAKVFWPDGTAVSAAIAAERTTESGGVRRGLVVRLGVRLTADGPPEPPVRVTVRTRGGLLTIDLRRA
jgi:Ca-activated chloride channel family protein